MVISLLMGVAVGVLLGDCSQQSLMGIDAQLIVGLLPVQMFSTYFGSLNPESLKISVKAKTLKLYFVWFAIQSYHL